MRIVFATHAYAPAVGGAEHYAQGLAEAIATAGHDVHVLTPNRISAEAFYEYGHSEAGERSDHINGVHVHRIPLDPPRSWRLGDARSFRPIPEAKARVMWGRYATTLSERIHELAPDATVTLPHAFPNVAAALKARSRGIAVYAPLLHEEDPAWRVEPVANLVAQSDVVLAMTTWERDRLIQSYRSPADQTHVAPPAVDAPDADAVKPHELDAPYVLAIGRRARSKGLLAIARAVDELNGDRRHVLLIVAGPGSDPVLDRELRGLRPVVIVGEVSEEAKWSLIKGSVASVSMSASESFGIGIAESWAMCRPVIARRIEPLTSIVDDGVDGFLVNNEQELAARITTLLANREVATRMGAAGNLKIRDTSRSTASTVLSAITAALNDSYNHPTNGGNSFDVS